MQLSLLVDLIFGLPSLSILEEDYPHSISFGCLGKRVVDSLLRFQGFRRATRCEKKEFPVGDGRMDKKMAWRILFCKERHPESNPVTT
jgi:hypothetical protein